MFVFFLILLDKAVFINRSFSTDFYFSDASLGPQEQESQMFGGGAVLQYNLLNEVLM